MRTLGEQISEPSEEKDRKKYEALIQRTAHELENELGSEYLALLDGLNDADPKSKDVQEILSDLDRLDEKKSCMP